MLLFPSELTKGNLVNVREKERNYSLDVIRCLRYLARQGIALQGNENNDIFTQLMMNAANSSFGQNIRKQICSS